MSIFVINQASEEDESKPRIYPEGASYVGYAAGVEWFSGDTIHKDGREPTEDELAAALLELPAIRQLKQMARRRIEESVGDLHDIQSDQSRHIEALTVMLCRLSAEYLGGTAMKESDKTSYLARVESILADIDSGKVTLRGNQGDVAEMLNQGLRRTSKVNEIVAADYLPRRDKVLS